MNKTLPIPEEEQLNALASGLTDVYRLLREYVGDLGRSPNFERHITVTRPQLAAYLRHHPHLAKKHVWTESTPKYHEAPVLERVENGYLVYEIDHGRARDTRQFESLEDAAAEYLMWGW